MKFLIVDDSVTMRRILANSLQDMGFQEFEVAKNGVEALSAFDGSIDFVITDWNMPNMGGLDFAKALREREDGQDVPILLLTRERAKAELRQVAQAGVENTLIKPFTPRVLQDKIHQVLGASAGAA